MIVIRIGVAAVLAGCGRLGFDAVGDAASDAGADVPIDAPGPYGAPELIALGRTTAIGGSRTRARAVFSSRHGGSYAIYRVSR